MYPDQELKRLPRCVLSLGMETATFRCPGQCCKQLSHRPALQGASPRSEQEQLSDCGPPESRTLEVRGLSHLIQMSSPESQDALGVILCHKSEVPQTANSLRETQRAHPVIPLSHWQAWMFPLEGQREKCSSR